MSGDSPPRLADYLAHILEAIVRIRRYTEGLDRQSFGDREMVQDAVLRNLEIIGEAAHNVHQRHPEFVVHHRDLPWMPAYDMRNALAHGYYRVDLDIVWRTLVDDLPELEAKVRALRDALAEARDP